jgi:hypothetical protein
VQEREHSAVPEEDDCRLTLIKRVSSFSLLDPGVSTYIRSKANTSKIFILLSQQKSSASVQHEVAYTSRKWQHRSMFWKGKVGQRHPYKEFGNFISFSAKAQILQYL